MHSFEIRDDFIGIFDNVLGSELCDKYIKFFDNASAENLTRGRNNLRHHVDDESIDIMLGKYTFEHNLNGIAVDFLDMFWAKCYPLYVKKYSILAEFATHNIFDIKIQKTIPGGGYHQWHTETKTLNERNRICAFMLYLNDVDEGGETEFLYQKNRFKPIKDRLLMWPAGYTHVHRGNPPLSNDKYIITGWLEYGV